MERFRVDIETYIDVDAEGCANAGEKAMDILNTAYDQDNKDAYFPAVEMEVQEA